MEGEDDFSLNKSWKHFLRPLKEGKQFSARMWLAIPFRPLPSVVLNNSLP
jgi:hypothetical protein